MKGKSLALNAVAVLAGSAALWGSLPISPASAAVTSITSSSTVLDIGLTVLGTPISVGPIYPASGAAPPAYSNSNGFASLTVSSGPFTLTTGLLSDTASGNTATGIGTASSSVADFSLVIQSGPITYLSFVASAVGSTSSVNSAPSATGSSTLADATLTVLGSSVSIGINPSPNDVIFDAGGLSIILNKQAPDPEESAGITTDAIAIVFSSFPAGFNLVNGSIDVAQSFASINVTPVPEPATWAMMLIGFTGLGFGVYRRTRTTPAVFCSV